jgi:hypothetical protein
LEATSERAPTWRVWGRAVREDGSLEAVMVEVRAHSREEAKRRAEEWWRVLGWPYKVYRVTRWAPGRREEESECKK